MDIFICLGIDGFIILSLIFSIVVPKPHLLRSGMDLGIN